MATTIEVAKLIAPLIADASDFSKGLNQAQKEAEGWGSSLQKVGKAALAGIEVAAVAAAAAVTAVTAAAVKLGVEGFKAAVDFQSQMAVLGIAASSSGLAFDELHDTALAVGGDISLLGVSATGAADSMTGLYKAGLTTTEIFGDLQGYMAGTAELGGALRAAIDLAAASELDMVQASDLAAVALATFGGELETEAERAEFVNAALNNMVKAADASVAEVSGLAAALKMVGPAAGAMGVSVQEVNNALALLSTRGIEGSSAGTSLNRMLLDVAKTSPKAAEMMEALSINIYDTSGAMLPLVDIVGQFETALGDATDAERDAALQAIFTAQGARAMNVLLKEGVEGWDAMADATANAMGISDQAAIKAGTFAGTMEALEGTFETVKIQIGEAFLPVAQKLVGWFSEMVDKWGPKLVAIYEAVGQGMETFTSYLLQGHDPLTAFQAALGRMGLADLANNIEHVRQRVQELITQVWEAIQPVVDWISQNVELQDVLIALGVIIATVVVPAVWAMMLPFIEIIAVFALVLAAVALLRAAWENDFLGIRTALTEFWENTAKPALESLEVWLKVNVPKAIETLRGFWEGVLLPAMQAVWAFISEVLIPIWVAVAEVAIAVVGAAITQLTDIWQNVLYPVLMLVWDFIQGSVMPLFSALADLAEAVLGAAIRVLAGIWEDTLYPALEKVWAFVQDHVIPILESLTGAVEDKLGPILQWLAEEVLPVVQSAFEKIGEGIQWVIDQIRKLIDWLDKVGDASSDVSAPSGPVESMAAARIPGMAELAMATGAGAISGAMYNYEFNQTIHDASPAAARMGFEEMHALVGA